MSKLIQPDKIMPYLGYLKPASFLTPFALQSFLKIEANQLYSLKQQL